MARIIFHGDPAELKAITKGRRVRHMKDGVDNGALRLAVERGVTNEGNSAVHLAIELDDGSVVLATTTLRLFASIAVGIVGSNPAELVAADIIAESPVDVHLDGKEHRRVGPCPCGKWHQPVPPGAAKGRN